MQFHQELQSSANVQKHEALLLLGCIVQHHAQEHSNPVDHVQVQRIITPEHEDAGAVAMKIKVSYIKTKQNQMYMGRHMNMIHAGAPKLCGMYQCPYLVMTICSEQLVATSAMARCNELDGVKLTARLHVGTNVGNYMTTNVSVMWVRMSQIWPRMSQLYDYECRNCMTTSVALIGLRMSQETTDVRPTFSHVLFFFY